jgi:hypothetical protein
MPGLQTILSKLNSAFSEDGIERMVAQRDRFAQGQSLFTGVVVGTGMRLHDQWKAYLDRIPKSIQEAIRATIYQALSPDAPTQITFAWAPNYDYELTIWYAPNVRATQEGLATKGGITILLKSTYPQNAAT